MNRSILTLVFSFCLHAMYAQNLTEDNPCLSLQQSLYLNNALSNEQEANAYMDSLTECSSDDAVNLLAQAKYLYENGAYNRAVKILKNIDIDNEANSGIANEVTFYLALNLSAVHDYQQAVDYYSKCIRNGYNPQWCYNNLGTIFKTNNQVDVAIKYFKKAVELDPEYALPYYNLGSIYYDKINFQKALENYILADSVAHHLNPRYRTWITIAYDELNMHDKTYESAKIGFEKFPNDWKIIKGMGIGLAAVGRYDEAQNYARILKSKEISSVDQLFDVGYLYDISGSEDTASYYYTVCLKLDPDYSVAMTNLAIFYKHLGKFEKAHEYLDRSLEIDSTDNWDINMKIQTYIWQHKYEKCLEWCEKYNALYMGGPHSYLNTGYALLLLDRYREAIPWLYKKLGQMPNDDRAWNNLGACYTGLDRPDSAMYCFARALENDSNNSYVYHNRALLNLKLGKEDDACRDLETALEKQYNWVIDEALLELQARHCPEVNVNREILIHAYTENSRELLNNPFIARFDSLAEAEAKDIYIVNDQDVSGDSFKIETDTQNAFQVYPNPSAGNVNILIPSQPEGDLNSVKLKIFDLRGKLVEMQVLNNHLNYIDLQDLAPGQYILLFFDSQNVLSTQKLIVSK